LAQLQFERAISLMKELKQDRKEYIKNIRLGRKTEALKAVKKYGIDFRADEEGATGLMLALYHGQNELIPELIKLCASLLIKDQQDKFGANYLLSGFLQNILQRKPQTATISTLKRFWSLINPNSFTYETCNRQFQANSHSMVYFLIILMRCLNELHPKKATYQKGTPDEKTMAFFNMDDMVKYAELIPGEILPPYRKKRQYINSILSSNEICRAGFPNCKMAFTRIDRGAYVVNHEINWL
jgi:hypothetical protein